MAMIEIQNVSKWYNPQFQVLKDCSLTVDRGDVVVVCGPSGSGKSTLIKTVNALEKIDAGSIAVNGTSVHGGGTDLPQLRSRVGMAVRRAHIRTRPRNGQ
jgi:glutamate/aspartate transport system ATP-binding protein